MTSSILSSLLPINPDNVFVAYNSNDFYWKTINYDDKFCQSQKCSTNTKINPGTILITENNSQKCYEKEVCINKHNSEILTKQQNLHSGSDGRYNDSESLFVYTLLNTANLGIGLIAILYSIRSINNR